MQVAAVVSRVQRRLRMARSLAVDVYAEDPIVESIQSAFDYYFKRFWWPQFKNDNTWTLDGATGTVTDDLTAAGLTNYEHIRAIWPDGDNDKTLSRLKGTMRPRDVRASTVPLYWEPITGAKVFRVLPLDATGTIDVRWYSHPGTLNIASEFMFDETLLTLEATLSYLTGNGANPSDIEKTRSELNEYWKTYKGVLEDDDIPIRSSSPDALNDWWPNP